MTARLQRSAGGVPLSLRSWLSHLFRGRPGPRLQLGSGRRSSDPVCGTARLGGQVCPLEVWQHVQTVSCDDRQTIGSSKGPRPVREETSVFRTWSCQRISYILGPQALSTLATIVAENGDSRRIASVDRALGVGISCGRLPAF